MRIHAPPPFLLSPFPYLWLHCLWDDSTHLWDPPALQASVSLPILFSSHRGLWMFLPLHLASLLLPQMCCSARSLISGLHSSSHFSPALGWFRALRQDAILPTHGLCLLWLHACPPSPSTGTSPRVLLSSLLQTLHAVRSTTRTTESVPS